MGAVDLVFDHTRGERVARKRIVDPSGVALLRFETEFRAIERLHHVNLVRLFELGQDAEGPFFTMEVVDGVDFATYCHLGDDASVHTAAQTTKRRGPIGPDARLRRVLPALLAALAFLHGHGIVHADLKPANLLVTHAGALKVLDFGVVAFAVASPRAAHHVALPGVAGTPAYMAAELFAGEPPTRASDVYALGIILIELYAGTKPDPFEAEPSPRASARRWALSTTRS